MVYDFWWIIVVGIISLIGLAILSGSKKNEGNYTNSEIKLFSLVGFVLIIFGVIGAVGIIVDSHNHYKTEYTLETAQIKALTGQKVIKFSGNWPDLNYPNLDDVQALLANGKSENFYYNPATGVMVRSKK